MGNREKGRMWVQEKGGKEIWAWEKGGMWIWKMGKGKHRDMEKEGEEGI